MNYVTVYRFETANGDGLFFNSRYLACRGQTRHFQSMPTPDIDFGRGWRKSVCTTWRFGFSSLQQARRQLQLASNKLLSFLRRCQVVLRMYRVPEDKAMVGENQVIFDKHASLMAIRVPMRWEKFT